MNSSNPISLLLALLLCVGLSALAADPATNASSAASSIISHPSTASAPSTATPSATEFAGTARIQFDSAIYEFGRVPCGQRIYHDFVFTNTGQAVLEINDVRPTCGCTLARVSERLIQPGKTGVIPVQLDTSEFVGTVYKTIAVLCNDRLTNRVVLALTGTTWKPVQITPQFAGFIVSSDAETNETRVLRITNNMDEAFSLSDPVCTNRAFSCALKTIRPGRDFELDVTFLQKNAPIAWDQPLTTVTQVVSTILLKSSSTKFEYVTINATGTIQPAVAAMPAELRLPVNGLTLGGQLSVFIRNYAAKPLVLSDPTLNIKGATIQARENIPGRVFLLSINLPTGSQCPPGQTAEIRVKTNHPQYPVLRIPVIEDKPAVAKPQS